MPGQKRYRASPSPFALAQVPSSSSSNRPKRTWKKGLRTTSLSNYGGLNTIYRFKQCVQRGTLQSQTAVITETNFAFAFSDLPQSGSFSALFDQYKIDWIVIKFMPRGNMNQASATNNQIMGTYLTAIDLDDTANISTEDALRQFVTCQEYEMYQPHTRQFKPHVAIAAYGGSVFTSFANAGNQWIDFANTGVPHYGCRTMLTNTNNNNDCYIDVRCEYYFSCKNVR